MSIYYGLDPASVMMPVCLSIFLNFYISETSWPISIVHKPVRRLGTVCLYIHGVQGDEKYIFLKSTVLVKL